MELNDCIKENMRNKVWIVASKAGKLPDTLALIKDTFGNMPMNKLVR